MMDTIKKMIQTFAYTVAGITISTALFITIFAPKLPLNILLLWQVILMSAICAVGNLIYYSRKVPSKNQMILRIICHYFYINFVVFGGAFLWNWLTPGLIPEILVMLLLVAVVYAIITVVCFRQEEIIAYNLNRQLRKQFPEQGEEDEL